MAGEFDQITNALKNAYPQKAVEAMINAETPFRNALSKNLPAGSTAGSGILKFGANLNPPQNNAQINDGASLVAPKDRTDKQLTLQPTIFSGGFQIGWMTKAAAASNTGAFNGGELRRRTEETLEDLGKDMERVYVSMYGSGSRCKVENNPGSPDTTFTAKLAEGVTSLRENMFISFASTDGITAAGDLRATSTGVVMKAAKITDINYTTRLVTVDATATGGVTDLVAVAADDFVHVVAVDGQFGLNSVKDATHRTSAQGLRGLVDDGTLAVFLHGLDRTAAGQTKLKANVNSAGSVLRSLTEQLLIRTCHETRARSGKRVTDIWTSPGQVEKYIEFVAPDRRYVVNGAGVQGMGTGYKDGSLVHYAPGMAAKFNMSFDIVPRELYLLNWDTFFHYEARKADWWDEGEMLKPTPSTASTYKASYLAYLAAVENIGCIMPIANSKIIDLKDPVVGDV